MLKLLLLQKFNPIISDISLIASAFFICNEWAYIFTVVDAIECPAKFATVTMSMPFDIKRVMNVCLSPCTIQFAIDKTSQ